MIIRRRAAPPPAAIAMIIVLLKKTLSFLAGAAEGVEEAFGEVVWDRVEEVGVVVGTLVKVVAAQPALGAHCW